MKTTQRSLPVLAVAVLALVALVSGACMSTVSPNRQLKDSEITAAVKTRLAADPDVAAINVDVDTLEGVVTLSGRVASVKEKDEAGEVARGTGGVRRVVNNLQVGDHS